MNELQEAPNAYTYSRAPSSLSFTQGFLLGQLSIVLLIGAFIKFFVFGEIPSSEHRNTPSHRRSAARPSSSSSTSQSQPHSHSHSTKQTQSHILRSPPRLTTSAILRKTYYNVDSHPPESLDWFNVLIGQTIAQFRTDAVHDDAILTSLTGLLNGAGKPDFLGEIKVTEINLGEEFPILSNCRVHPVCQGGDGAEGGDGDGEGGGNEEEDDRSSGTQLQARMDVDLSDFITMGVDTKIILNYPRPQTAVLPVALAISIVRFSGTLSISFLPSHSEDSLAQDHASLNPSKTEGQSSVPQPPSTTPTTLAFSFLPDYRLDISVRSLVGSRSRLQDIPKIAQLVESRLHQWIDERCVEPRVQQVVLPSLWPRKKNTRGRSDDGAGGGGGGGGPSSTPRNSFGRAAGKDVLRDLREEARRELEEERKSRGAATLGAFGKVGTDSASASAAERTSGFEDGLRWRRKEYDLPGRMPGGLSP